MQTSKLLLMIIISINLINLIASLHYDLVISQKRCFIEELYKGNMAMIKWHIKGLELGTEDQQKQYYNAVSLRVSSEKDSQNIIVDDYLKTHDGKLSFLAKEDGQYKICTFLFPSKYRPNNRITMELIVLSDNMDEPSLLNVVKKDEVDRLHSKVDSIIRKGDIYLKQQNKLIKLEDEDSNSIIKMQKIFYYLTIVQIFIVISLGAYQLYNLKSYLDNNVLDF